MHPNLKPGEDFVHFLDRQAKEMREKAAALSEAFTDSAATVSSRDGSVTATVAPNGALRDLRLGHRACELGPARLTAAIMETVRLAQRQTARSVTDAFVAVSGDSEAADLIRSYLPPETEPGEPGEQGADAAEPPPSPPPAPPPPPASVPPRQQPPARRRRASDENDEDEARPW